VGSAHQLGFTHFLSKLLMITIESTSHLIEIINIINT
jgi:hypothetical protein